MKLGCPWEKSRSPRVLAASDNAAMRKAYKRTPTQIRRLAKQTTPQPQNEYISHLRFRPPYHWQGMLAFLAPRAVPGVEAVRDNAYLRSICRWHHGPF